MTLDVYRQLKDTYILFNTLLAPKKIIISVSIIVFFAVLAGTIFFLAKSNKKINIFEKNSSVDQPLARNNLFVSGWLPYWSKTDGAGTLEPNLPLFSEINPFAFEVNADGSIKDTLKFESAPWPDLRNAANKNDIAVIPTLLWADPDAMHKVFLDSGLLSSHISAISDLLDKYNFSGIDIDYEGKDIADRNSFSLFLKNLNEKLSPQGKSINCTVEPRTADNPPDGWNSTQAMAYANDFSALNKYCNSVRIMAYDETIQTHGFLKRFDDPSETLSAPNADNQWVEQVIQYALKYIPAEKIALGIPTYGWEFQFTKIAQGYHYERVQSVSFPKAMEEAKNAGVTPARDSGGELSFTYTDDTGSDIVTFSDAEAIREKIELAKKYNLKGVSLFKLDGETDPNLFSMLKNYLGK